MKAAGIAAAVIVAAAVAAWLVDDGGEDAREDTTTGSITAPRGCPPPGPSAVDPETGRLLCGKAARVFIERVAAPARRLFSLDRRERAAVRRIVARDRTLDRLRGGTPYVVRRLGPWTAKGGEPKFGAVAELRLARPVDATAKLPYVCSGDPRVGSGRISVEMRRVTRLLVSVDLRSGEIASVTPITRPGGVSPVVVRRSVPVCAPAATPAPSD